MMNYAGTREGSDPARLFVGLFRELGDANPMLALVYAPALQHYLTGRLPS